ncbi:copper amine oxidase N-terminal domain-containing protein [Paenibacillus filicis]|uniref:Copper amine oxidase N-terminal domain-containing protein n=1 Tax=Paenibacillus filicis TaxID=669464 RepID=A0ABU9DRA6_9BACL
MKKKLLAVTVLLMLFSGVATASSINGDYKGYPIVKLVVNGNEISSEIPAIIIDGVTMVPLRVVSEKLGAKVSWSSKTYTVDINSTGQAQSQNQNKKANVTLYSNDGKVYLGKLTADTTDPDSIYNEFGSYGGTFSAKSIFNEFGDYGSEFSDKSAFNKFATHPPIVVLNGSIMGYLTINSTLKDAINPQGLREFLEDQGY